MADYNSKDLKSTLSYIKKQFGMEVFKNHEKIIALFSDLAPMLKREKIMLKRLSETGILKEFIVLQNENVKKKRSFILRAQNILTKIEYIQPKIVADYLGIIVNILEWNIDIQIPEDVLIQEMKFDVYRYSIEKQEYSYVKAMRAYIAEDYLSAKLLFSKAYSKGNILAGIKLAQMYYYGEAGEKNFEAAFELFLEGSINNYPLAQEWIALIYMIGIDMPENKKKAEELSLSCHSAMIDMCACGDSDAQYLYGWKLLYGILCDINQEEGYYWLSKAASAKHLQAKVEVATCYIKGWGCIQNIHYGLELMRKYAKTSNTKAHYRLGKMHMLGNYVEKDYREAKSLLMFAAERGHTNAQRYMGDIYYFGFDVQIDYLKAHIWYVKSAASGNSAACSKLGDIYFFSKGAIQDIHKAFRYYKLAADKGNKYCQYMLHNWYFSNEEKYHLYKNYEMGRQYLEKSAEQDYIEAQKLLAQKYRSDFEFHDDKKFIYWIKRAAEQNDAEAQRILGQAYYQFENNSVLPENCPNAIKWLEKAVEGQDILAMIYLAQLYVYEEGIEKNLLRIESLLKNAENEIKTKEAEKKELKKEHHEIADLYYTLYPNDIKRQFAFEHYCKAYMLGDEEALFDLGRMYFFYDCRSDLLYLSQDKLLEEIKEKAICASAPDLCYLLGEVYSEICEYKEAETWYLLAKERGLVSARCCLAIIYINKWHKYEKGFQTLQKAYEEGSIEGTRLLAICYKYGIGIKKNKLQAKILLKEAANEGDKEAIKELRKFWF